MIFYFFSYLYVVQFIILFLLFTSRIRILRTTSNLGVTVRPYSVFMLLRIHFYCIPTFIPSIRFRCLLHFRSVLPGLVNFLYNLFNYESLQLSKLPFSEFTVAFIVLPIGVPRMH